MLRGAVAVARIALGGMLQRKWSTLSTIVGVAIVTATLLAFLAMADGFRTIMRGSGDPEVIVLVEDGTRDEMSSSISRESAALIESLYRARTARPISTEVMTVVSVAGGNDGQRLNVAWRGLTPEGLALRRTMRIVAGRPPRPGSTEILLGRAVANQLARSAIGQSLRVGPADWHIIGIFEAGGGLLESEIIADRDVVQNLFERPAAQSIRMSLRGDAVEEVRRAIATDPRVNLSLQTERQLLESQSMRPADLARRIGWPLSLIMAVGALAGALNTMYAAVQSRTSELVTLRIIGFRRAAVFGGTMIESIVLALAGGVVGIAACYLLFHGMTASTLGGTLSKVVFKLEVTPAAVMQGLLFAALIGFAGGFFPALRAARLPLVGAATE
jgi:putative ABC transport system permease protein